MNGMRQRIKRIFINTGLISMKPRKLFLILIGLSLKMLVIAQLKKPDITV
jgi:hypothetical protein